LSHLDIERLRSPKSNKEEKGISFDLKNHIQSINKKLEQKLGDTNQMEESQQKKILSLKGNFSDSAKNLHTELLQQVSSQQKPQNKRAIDPALDYLIAKTDKGPNSLDNYSTISGMTNQQKVSDNNGKTQQFRYQSRVIQGTQPSLSSNHPSQGEKQTERPYILPNYNGTNPSYGVSRDESKNVTQEELKPGQDRGLIQGLSNFVKIPTSGQTSNLRVSDHVNKPAISYEKPLTLESNKNTPGKAKEDTTVQRPVQDVSKGPIQLSLTANSSPRNIVKYGNELADARKVLNFGTIPANLQLTRDSPKQHPNKSIPAPQKQLVLTSTPDKAEWSFEKKKYSEALPQRNLAPDSIDLFSTDGKNIKQSRVATPTSSSQKQQNTRSDFVQPSTFEPLIKRENPPIYYQPSDTAAPVRIQSKAEEPRFTGPQLGGNATTLQTLSVTSPGHSAQEMTAKKTNPAPLNSGTVRNHSKTYNALTLKPIALDQREDFAPLKVEMGGSNPTHARNTTAKQTQNKLLADIKLPSFEQCKRYIYKDNAVLQKEPQKDAQSFEQGFTRSNNSRTYTAQTAQAPIQNYNENTEKAKQPPQMIRLVSTVNSK
jgi:hypothetical protein